MRTPTRPADGIGAMTCPGSAAVETSPAASGGQQVRLEHLGVRLGRALVLDQVTLSVPAASMVGLLGPNGSGKSTLLRAIWRAVQPVGGAVLLDGQNVAGMSARQLARHVAVLMQDDGTDPRFTARQVVETGRLPHRSLLGADTDRGDPVGNALAQAAVADLADRPIGTLSGGQRQRVLAARTLAQDTPIVLLDEPTNHLDLAAQWQLLDLFRRRGATVVAALHDLNLAAAYCDHLHLLHDGHLIASGAPDQVLTPELISRVFDVAAAITTNPLTGTRAVHIGPRPCTESTP